MRFCDGDFADSLEEQILLLLWEKGQALNGSEIRALLSGRHYDTPWLVLFKILNTLTRANVIAVESGIGWGKRYRPAMSREEFYNQSSEFLVIACLQSEGALLKGRRHLDIVRQITQLVFHRDKRNE